MATSDVVACLLRARRELIHRGWTRLAIEDGEGRIDLRHAVLIASGGDDDLALAACAALYEAGARGGYGTDSGPRTGLEGSNDSLGTYILSNPLDEVVLLIHRAITALGGERRR